MRCSVGLCATLVVFAAAPACSPPLPAPAYRLMNGAPAVMVTCRNTSGAPINPAFALDAIRLDGVTHDVSLVLGSLLGGPPPDVPPGGTWSHLVVLHPDRSVAQRSTERGGAAWRDDRVLNVAPGRHSIAVKCGGNWTAAGSFEYTGSAR